MILKRISAFPRFFLKRMSRLVTSSLLRRIVFINLLGLFVLVFGIFYLTSFREGLVDSRVRSLFLQGEIMAGAIATSALSDNDHLAFDAEKFFDSKPGEMVVPFQDKPSYLEFPINPEKVALLFRTLVRPKEIRAVVYDKEGELVVDSSDLHARLDISRYDLPHLDNQPSLLKQSYYAFLKWVRLGDFPQQREIGKGNGKGFPEVGQALNGARSSSLRMTAQGEVVVSIAIPIQKLHGVSGALMLTTSGGDIDDKLTAERLNIVKMTLIAGFVMLILSLLLAQGIAEPMRRLSAAADRVKGRIKTRETIPDFSNRSDEIGVLSLSLQEMTAALYNRIEATEKFAADVAHELKNPLTSLRSAVETLPLAKTEQSQARLLEVISHDVRRLDRLITDISQASRLDADMARRDYELVDIYALLQTLTDMANGTKSDVSVVFLAEKGNYSVECHPSRLAQVINNLLDNARSFSPKGEVVTLSLTALADIVDIKVEDKGTGIPTHALLKIFERFYTDRPSKAFGQNSGLGLAIAKQIIEGHGGKIWAENREEGGARFTVQLPFKQ